MEIVLILMLGCGMGAITYVYFGVTFMTIANKTGTPDAWWAWIPILNLLLLIKIANKPLWWIILFFIPVAHLIVSILTWMSIAERRGKPNWYGVLIIVPCVGFFVPAILAFSD